MKTFGRAVSARIRFLTTAVGALLLAAFVRLDPVMAAAAVSAPPISNGSYTVTYTSCAPTVACYLEEKTGAGGTWIWAPGQVFNPSTHSGTASYGKPAGTYYYRAGEVYNAGGYGAYVVYSPETTVVVSSAPPPTVDTVAVQSGYTYETRRGDINADGLQDIFVRRIAGGTSGNGTIDTVILQRLASGGFTQFVPSTAQAAVAAAWPVVLTELDLLDFNLV